MRCGCGCGRRDRGGSGRGLGEGIVPRVVLGTSEERSTHTVLRCHEAVAVLETVLACVRAGNTGGPPQRAVRESLGRRNRRYGSLQRAFYAHPPRSSPGSRGTYLRGMGRRGRKKTRGECAAMKRRVMSTSFVLSASVNESFARREGRNRVRKRRRRAYSVNEASRKRRPYDGAHLSPSTCSVLPRS